MAALFDDIKPEESWEHKRPLLSHYTSLDAVESIFRTNEIWFSNPLLMNDVEEVRFGIVNGANIVLASDDIRKALVTDERYTQFRDKFSYYVDHFERNHLFDTYVFCLSEHDVDDTDGILSMWRGYGSNGNGAAIIFDTAKFEPAENSPFVFSSVRYAAREEMMSYLSDLSVKAANIISRNHIPDEFIYLASYYVFERIKLYALFSKHNGFSEEREWRIVYVNDRNQKDDNLLCVMRDYKNNKGSIEPILKLRLDECAKEYGASLRLDEITDSIILGPTHSSALAVRSVQRMLELVGKSGLIDRVIPSSIPFRPR